ncbi:hypothetical protein DSM104443_01150 [Usitatibacter rugosus]|uniref:VCBS repeat protein n=1 Tax=Usitatibacter rugosus TaxID=2732067 RepID=A0A6M4GTA9_9PROT|nr:hypothetical protein [Usitatibacter rugosus]QJR10098.1 hypothetical protein DSM104443_01150 [Usitatibacter rugosus]
MLYRTMMIAALALSGAAAAQDAQTWLGAQGLEAVEIKPFQDLEIVVAKSAGAKEQRLVIIQKGKPVFQTTPKENEGAAKWAIHSMGNDLDGDGQPDLHVSSFSGGAHCCTTHYIVKLKPKVSKLAVYPANNVGGGDFLEVPGRKTPIMVTADDSSAYGFAPYANSYFPAVILEVSPKGRFQFAQDLMRSKLPGQPPPVCAQPAATNNPWLKERCGEYTSARRNARVAEIKTKLAEIKQGRSADQLKWDDYYATGVLAAVSAEMNRYAYTGHAAAALNWLETLWPGNDAVKLKMLNTLRTAWTKSVFAEDLKGLAADYR